MLKAEGTIPVHYQVCLWVGQELEGEGGCLRRRAPYQCTTRWESVQCILIWLSHFSKVTFAYAGCQVQHPHSDLAATLSRVQGASPSFA